MKKIITSSFLTFAFSLFTFFCEGQYTVIHNFGGADGDVISGTSLVLSGKTLFGMAQQGGVHDSGLIFSIDTNGNNFKDLYDFGGLKGAYPTGGLTLSTGGNILYGATKFGGAHNEGVIFSIDTDGTGYTHHFDFGTSGNSAEPIGTLTLAGNRLWGMTYAGGTGYGTLFFARTDLTNWCAQLIQFAQEFNPNGAYPYGSLTLLGTKVYGMTLSGGITYPGDGCIFSVDTNTVAYKDLFNFDMNTTGADPYGALTLYGNKFYSATWAGFWSVNGDIFSIDTNGSTDYTELHLFNGDSGAGVKGTLLAYGNKLYGMTYSGGGIFANGKGTIFYTDTNGPGYNNLYTFNGTTGGNPEGSLTRSGNTLYGIAERGPTNNGVVFKFYLGNTTKVTVIHDTICPGDSALLFVTGITNATYSWSPGGGTKDSVYVKPVSTKEYTVTIAQSSSRSYIDSVKVVVIPLETPHILGNSIVCRGVRDTLGVSGGASSYLWSNGLTTTTYYTGPIMADSTITVKAYNSLGCSFAASYTITVGNPRINIAPKSICVGGCAILKAVASGISPYTYLWSGLGNTTDTVTVCPSSTKYYTVTVSNAWCSSIDSALVTVNSCLGINEITNNDGILIYPNPNSGKFNVIVNSKSSMVNEIQVYNVLGERVLTETLRSAQGDNNIDLSSQPNGIYLYRVIAESGELVGEGKVVIEK